MSVDPDVARPDVVVLKINSTHCTRLAIGGVAKLARYRADDKIYGSKSPLHHADNGGYRTIYVCQVARAHTFMLLRPLLSSSKLHMLVMRTTYN